jgi:hypothetical protein
VTGDTDPLDFFSRSAAAAATYASINDERKLRLHRLVTYRCPRGDLLLDVIKSPAGVVLFHWPAFEVPPARNAVRRSRFDPGGRPLTRERNTLLVIGHLSPREKSRTEEVVPLWHVRRCTLWLPARSRGLRRSPRRPTAVTRARCWSRLATAVDKPDVPTRDLAALTRRLVETAHAVEAIDARSDQGATRGTRDERWAPV